MPAFWLAIMALTFLSIYLHWAPPFAYRAPWDDPLHNLEQLLLPTLILGCANAALLMRVTRAAMLDVPQHDYVRTRSPAPLIIGQSIAVEDGIAEGVYYERDRPAPAERG